jgi:gas vesicle protein
MNTITGDTNPQGSGRIQVFGVGVLAGAALGAGLMMWLAPRAAAEARRTVTDSANALREATTEGFQQARDHVRATMNDVGARGLGVRDEVADAVEHGALEVARVAVAVKTMPPLRQL